MLLIAALKRFAPSQTDLLQLHLKVYPNFLTWVASGTF